MVPGTDQYCPLLGKYRMSSGMALSSFLLWGATPRQRLRFDTDSRYGSHMVPRWRMAGGSLAAPLPRFPEDDQWVIAKSGCWLQTRRHRRRQKSCRGNNSILGAFRKTAVVACVLQLLFPEACDMTTRALRFVGFTLTLLVLSATAYAEDRDEATGATGVTLYEISERVTFDQAQGVILRNATSPLQGFAALGTPLCPSAFLISVPRIKSCTVIATGTDSVDTLTGIGPVSGTFDVVINAPGNSSVHVPDLPVINGTFTGTVDLSLAVLHHIPLGSITGTFTIMRTADPATGTQGDLPQPVVLPSNGTFRMPFKLGGQGRFERSKRDHAAVYLADDLHTVIPVKAFERSTGFPDVRLEVNFGF